MKLTLLLLVLLNTASLAGTELTIVDEPDTDVNSGIPGLPGSTKVKKRVFSRDGSRVAELSTYVVTLNGKVERTTQAIHFRIDGDNWVFIGLDKPGDVTSRTTTDVYIQSTDDTITISAPQRKYFELFLKGTRTFLEGKRRDMMADQYSKNRPTLR